MGDEGNKPSAVGNRTIQIDALTDVDLVDHAVADVDDDASNDAIVVGAAPPPLPSKRKPRSTAQLVGLTGLALVGGVAFALVVVHFLFPSAPGAPTPTASAPAPQVRHLQMDDETVIRAGE